MKTVLYIQGPGETTISQLKLAGARKGLEGSGYQLHKVTLCDDSLREIGPLTSFWDARGLIVDCRGRLPPVNERRHGQPPLVFLDVARAFASSRHSSVSIDVRGICHLATRELLSLGCLSYGYAGYDPDVPWSEERKRLFARALKLNGHDLDAFALSPTSVRPTVFYSRLKSWILKAPKPLGIFAADDSYALHVYSVIRKMKLRMPSQVALIGIDNEDSAVDVAGLTSVQLDFQKGGRLAAELLLRQIRHPRAAAERRFFGPVQLLRRSTTRQFRSRSENIASILSRIRAQSPRGLTAREVATWMPGSRRLAEMAFRRATGRSILEEITSARLARARELLAGTAYPVGEVAELCGYRTSNAFRNAFRAATGHTPRDWRTGNRESTAT